MSKKDSKDLEASKRQSASDKDFNSRDSVHGYMEMGNDAETHEKARGIRNNENGSHR